MAVLLTTAQLAEGIDFPNNPIFINVGIHSPHWYLKQCARAVQPNGDGLVFTMLDKPGDSVAATVVVDMYRERGYTPNELLLHCSFHPAIDYVEPVIMKDFGSVEDMDAVAKKEC